MKKILLSLCFTVVLHFAFGQTPGYMGKKFSLYYTASLFPSIQPSEPANYYGSSGHSIGINLRNDLSLDYAISKSVSLGASLKLISTSLPNALYYNENYNGYNYFQDAFLGDIKLKGTAYSFYIKNFNFKKRGSIAPVGYYTKWEFMLGHVTGKTGSAITPQDENYNYLPTFEQLGFDAKESFGGVLFSFGRQSLFFDRLFVTTGATIGIVPGGLYFTVGDQYYGNEANYHEAVNYRMFGYFLLNFNLGIGLLAF